MATVRTGHTIAVIGGLRLRGVGEGRKRPRIGNNNTSPETSPRNKKHPKQRFITLDDLIKDFHSSTFCDMSPIRISAKKTKRTK